VAREEAVPVKNRLKVLRAERDWSQQDLADKLGVSRQTINAIETEKYDPSLPLALKIGRLFDQVVEEIFTLDDFGSRKERAQSARARSG
jgi:putative transcriptional regulator